MIQVSIIIPTYKRKNSLMRLLKSLAPEIKNNHEILISEQGEDNGSEYIAFARRNNINLQYKFLEKSIGTSIAKNEAVKITKGKFLIFFDDDVKVEKGIITNLIKNFQDSQVGAVCGRVITPGQPIEGNNKNVGRISLLGKFSDGFSSKIKQEIDTVIGCNCAWRAEIFNKIGGFDEQFTGAIREDSDLSLRTKYYGSKIIFEPNAVVHHLREPSGGGRKTEGRLQWYYNFLSNETYFFLKHRPKVLVPIILLFRSEWILRCMFGFGREVSLRSIVIPYLGIFNGITKYRRYSYEHRG